MSSGPRERPTARACTSPRRVVQIAPLQNVCRSRRHCMQPAAPDRAVKNRAQTLAPRPLCFLQPSGVLCRGVGPGFLARWKACWSSFDQALCRSRYSRPISKKSRKTPLTYANPLVGVIGQPRGNVSLAASSLGATTAPSPHKDVHARTRTPAPAHAPPFRQT